LKNIAYYLDLIRGSKKNQRSNDVKASIELDKATEALNSSFSKFEAMSNSGLESLGFGYKETFLHNNESRLYINLGSMLSGVRVLEIYAEHPLKDNVEFALAYRRIEFSETTGRDILPVVRLYETDQKRNVRLECFNQY